MKSGTGQDLASRLVTRQVSLARQPAPLYTPEQRRRRDASPWTLVQGDPGAAAVPDLPGQPGPGRARYLATGEGYALATGSVVVKTARALRHHDHRLDLGEGGVRPLPVRPGLLLGRRVQHAGAGAAHGLPRRRCSPARARPRQQMLLALAAYAAYAINATQFLLKLRAARLERRAGAAVAAGAPPVSAARRCLPRPAPGSAAPTRRSCASAASARCSAA